MSRKFKVVFYDLLFLVLITIGYFYPYYRSTVEWIFYIIFISGLTGIIYSKGEALTEYFTQNIDYVLSSFYLPYNIVSDIVLLAVTLYFNYYILAILINIFYIIHIIYYVKATKSIGETNE